MDEKLVVDVYGKMEEVFRKFNAPEDLQQHFWLEFLQKDEDKITEMYNRGELMYYLVGWIKKQMYSTTSSYYRLYDKYYEKMVSLDELE